MLTSAFSFSLNQPVQEKGAILSKLDEQEGLSLICVTLGGKVFIYTPSESLQENSLSFLSLNKEIINLVAKPPLLYLASQTTLLAYNPITNSQLFNKDLEDGIKTLAIGYLPLNSQMVIHFLQYKQQSEKEQSFLIVGGNCQILGFQGENDIYVLKQELFTYFNVASEWVTSLAFSDIDGDGEKEMVVGCENGSIQVLKGEDIIYEMTEGGTVECLCEVTKESFGFGLQNGMVGIYERKNRKWRAKSQGRPINIVQGIFLQDDKFRPLIVGRINGQIEIREQTNGDIIHKLSINENLAALLQDDFRGDKTMQIIAIGINGTVKGFTLSPNQQTVTDQSSTQQKLEMQDQIEQLQKRKQNLMIKYQSLQDAQSTNPNQSKNEQNMLPQDTKIGHYFQHNIQQNCVEIVFKSNKNTYLKSAILFNDKLFTGESLFYCPKKISSELKIPLKIDKCTQENIRAKIIIGSNPHAQYFQVYDIETYLPKFSPYLYVEDFDKYQAKAPKGKLQLKINERIPRYMKWLEQSFILDIEQFEKIQEKSDKAFTLEAKFINVVDWSTVYLQVNSAQGSVLLACNSIEVAGDMVQDLCHYMNFPEQDSQGEFPEEMAKFKLVLDKVEQFKSSRTNITTDIANSVNNVKTLIVKAEDSRIQGDMSYVRKYYADVMGENQNLTQELLKRTSNTQILTDGLKQINSMINKAANLRVGQHKTRVTNLCRNAIKNNDLRQLCFIIENGREI